MLWPRFQKNPRSLTTPRPRTHQGGAINPGMPVEDGFTGNGKEGALGSDHAMRFAAAKPESIAVVQIANVSHAMPKGTAVLDLVQSIGLGARYVLRGHHGAPDNQLSNFPRPKFLSVFDVRDRLVVNADHLPLDALKAATNARSPLESRFLTASVMGW